MTCQKTLQHVKKNMQDTYNMQRVINIAMLLKVLIYINFRWTLTFQYAIPVHLNMLVQLLPKSDFQQIPYHVHISTFTCHLTHWTPIISVVQPCLPGQKKKKIDCLGSSAQLTALYSPPHILHPGSTHSCHTAGILLESAACAGGEFAQPWTSPRF